MKKRIWATLCIIGVVCTCSFVIWNLFNENFAPKFTRSYDVDIDIRGDIDQMSEIETQLHEIIGGLEDKTENIKFRNAEYSLDSNGVGTAVFSYNFDGQGTAYSRFWEQVTSQNAVGVVELYVSLPDATLYHVNYHYGYIEGISGASQSSLDKTI